MNMYGYTGNDPVNFVDPYGMFEVCKTFFYQTTTRNDEDEGEVTSHKTEHCFSLAVSDFYNEELKPRVKNAVKKTIDFVADVANQTAKCGVAEGELSLGFQMANQIKLGGASIGYTLDGFSVRGTTGSRGSKAEITQGIDLSLAREITDVGFSATRSEPVNGLTDRAIPRLRSQTFEPSVSAFSGFEYSGAFVLGGKLRLGIDTECLEN